MRVLVCFDRSPAFFVHHEAGKFLQDKSGSSGRVLSV
jgi:hypothetical protein